MPRPTLFIGSSSEGHRIAQAVQVNLDRVCEVKLWTQGPFGLTKGTLESLVAAADRFDFAVLVLTADDLNISRGIAKRAARDNVLFELGLFIGSLGRDRTFIICDSADGPELPSDLAGVTVATFIPHSDGNLEAALGSTCTMIQAVIERLGARRGKSAQTGHGIVDEPAGWFRGLTDGSRVGYEEALSGAAVNIPPGVEAWVVVQPALEPTYWPQRNLALDQAGNFRTVAQFGRGDTRDIGGEFILLLVAAPRDASAQFRDSRIRLAGLPELPLGVQQLARVAVTRALDDAWGLRERGETYRLMGRHDEALADLNRTVELRPDYAEGFATRAAIYRDTGRYEEALADLDRAVGLSPDYFWALALRGAIYRDTGRRAEALADFDRAIELNPNDAWALREREKTQGK